MQGKRIFGLDLLRAIAISLVVISHCSYLIVSETDNAIILLVRILGAAGVDLFFVLSGFLIGGILLKQLQNNQTQFSNLFTFWKRRWLRTLPNYFLILLINIILIVIFSEALPSSILSYFLFLQNFTNPHPDFFTEAWSLSIEEYAYLILPMIMFVVFNFFKKRQALSLFFWTTLIVIIISFILKVVFYFDTDISSYKEWSNSFRKVVIYRLDAIYIGFLLVYIFNKHTQFLNTYKHQLLIASGLTFFIVHGLIYYFNMQPQTHLWFYVFGYLLLVILSFAMLFPYAVAMKPFKKFSKFIIFISTRSYAIYLVNYSIVLLTLQRLIDFNSLFYWQRVILTLVFLFIALLISNLIYLYFEKPILKFRNDNVKQPEKNIK